MFGCYYTLFCFLMIRLLPCSTLTDTLVPHPTIFRSTKQAPAKLRENHGGVWGEYPEYPANDWRLEVENHDTRIGYWEWVAAKIEQAELENAEDGDTVQTDGSVDYSRDYSLGRPTY